MRNTLVYRKKVGELLFYVSESMEKSVIVQCHDQLGYLGIGETINSILSNCSFLQTKDKIEKHIRKKLFEIHFIRAEYGKA